MAVCGFSDGASLALALGLSNGDLFQRVIAFSPGFIPSGVEKTGMPRIFISHGTRDEILPIENASRPLVSRLKRGGYDVTFREFDGPHGVPPEIARTGIEWFLKS
jgi:predicted esterase